MKREEFIEKWGASMGHGFTDEELSADLDSLFPLADGARKVQWSGYGELGNISQKPLQPIAEGAEEIIESIVESLGDPIYIHNHVFEIRPYTVEHKTEWWIFHKEVGSGEPLAQWLNKFATLHAQRIADKMVGERLREELIAYDKWATRHLNGSGKIFTAEGAVDEYLKSR